MCRKLIFLISLVLVISLGINASAATLWYTDDDVNDHLWSSSINWNGSTVLPGVEDGARQESLVPDTNTCINIVDANNTAAHCKYYWLGAGWYEGESSCWLIIDGGSLTVVDYLDIAHYEGVPGPENCNRMIVEPNSTVIVGGDFHIGHWDDGLLKMNGGEVTIGHTLWVCYYQDSTVSYYSHAQLDAGVVTAGDFGMRYEDPTLPGGTMDITAGKLVITQDRRSLINNYIQLGWISAYNGRGNVNVALVGGNTEVTGSANFAIAWGPSPKSGAADVLPGTVLKWAPGDFATRHNVYFGTSLDDVNDSALPVEENLDTNTYSTDLAMSKTYYWRVDEVNDSDEIWQGNIWNFKTADNVAVENFEYTSDDDLWSVWRDYYYYNETYVGRGSQVLWEGTIVHDANIGSASMKYAYKNNGSDGYSSADRSYDPNLNLTIAGTRALDVWFRGTAGNDAERMYVGLRDEVGATYKEVAYSRDANELKNESWMVWHIDVQDFSGVGMDLSKIAKLYIIFKPLPGGTSTGTVYFDDIAAYPCRPGSLAGDLNDDCLLDFKDLALFMGNWLERQVAP
jgi:hypothetical protein